MQLNVGIRRIADGYPTLVSCLRVPAIAKFKHRWCCLEFPGVLIDAYPHQIIYLLELIMIPIWKIGKSVVEVAHKIGFDASYFRHTDTGHGDATHGSMKPPAHAQVNQLPG